MKERALLTILCEPTLEPQILTLLKRSGSSGWSVSRAEGDPDAGWALVMEGAHVRIETLVSDETASRILRELEERHFAHRSLIVWKQTVEVLRPDRFT